MSAAIELFGPAGARALIEPRGAALVGLRLNEVDAIPDCDNAEATAGFAGSTLAPWPNRIAAGRWQFEGKPLQLITEPGDGLGNALHGYAYSRTFELLSQSASSVLLALDLDPAVTAGYPFAVRIEVEYQLSEVGLRSTITAINLGQTPAPVAFGAHPYFAAPVGTTLTFNAEFAGLDSTAMIPARRGNISEIGLASQRPQQISELSLDHEFSGFAAGNAQAILTHPDGVRVIIEQDSAFGYQMIYNPSDFPWTHGTAPAIAIEPQTAAIDSFNNRLGLATLLPGERLEAGWQVRVER